jgi:hypothetical protein
MAGTKADLFMDTWRAAGLRMVERIVFHKAYASSVRCMRYQHEQAYLLAKGDVIPPRDPLSDVMDFPYGARRTAGSDRRDWKVRHGLEVLANSSGVWETCGHETPSRNHLR